MKDNTNRSPAVELQVDRDGRTGGLQLSIGNPKGGGFRLAGPKYNGSSTNLMTVALNERSAREIRAYLDACFPVDEAG